MDQLPPPATDPVDTDAVLKACTAVLKANDHGDFTAPAAKSLYPHQWLWDSCFIAIGLRHLDPERAAEELASLTRGQWANGMLPHMIFNTDKAYRREREVWRSWLNPYAPDTVATSGITQPPMIAEAVVRVGEKLKSEYRREFYQFMYEPLVAHHRWLYAERDPHSEGLTLQIHPYEVGLDNTPPWMEQLKEHSQPWWISAVAKLKLQFMVNMLRRDSRYVPPGQRMDSLEALLMWDTVRRLRRKHFDIDKVLHRSLFCTEDLTFNCILIRANQHLRDIAHTLRRTLPGDLIQHMDKTEKTLDKLWDEPTGQYYSRDFVTHKLLRQPSVATFMPLYAGTISRTRAERLVKVLEDHTRYWLHHPVPSVPLNSEYFSQVRYWQGPTWINTNWLIIDGLKRYGHTELAAELVRKSVELVAKSGSYEYFSPIDGQGLGAPDFSWTAALTIDLLKTPDKFSLGTYRPRGRQP